MDDDGSYIRRHYNVPAERGQRVIANGKSGTIKGFAGAYLLVLIDGEAEGSLWHPTWEMQYLPHDDRQAIR